MGLQDLFPYPQRLTATGAAIDFSLQAVVLSAPAAAPDLVQQAVAQVRPFLPNPPVKPESAYPIKVHVDAQDAALARFGRGETERYRLELGATAGELVAASPVAAFAGCQTIRQLLQDAPTALPELQILDWPDFRYRGLYIEAKWGPDLMTLSDWQGLIDYMAALKFNSLGVGVYGCWVVQYGGQTTEFMLLPFPDYPELVTPKTLRYYSAANNGWQTMTYLPRMATEDFFGDLVAYAKTRNITIRPHFNAPGHNTLIPRAYPEVSAQNPDGTPIGYGFCLSNPRTYELLFALYDSVVERYLRPHGVDWFHIGLDEVTGYMGIDPQQPFTVTEPWCQCPQCRDLPRSRQLQDYVVRVCAHLREQGVNHITLWNDALESLGALNEEFVAKLEAAGLRDSVAVQWWRYREPTLVPRAELGLRSWVTPMAGYWSNLFTQSYTANIFPMLWHGHRAGAEGADAYCIYDPAFDRNYVCLANYAWNQSGGEDLYEFKSRYARAKLEQWLEPVLAAEAFTKYDQVFDAMSWTETALDSLLYYWHTYPASRRRGHYPQNVLADLLDERLRLRGAYQRLAAHATVARDFFAQAEHQSNDPLLAEYRAECDKFIGVWATFASLLQAIEHYRQARTATTPADSAETVEKANTQVGRARAQLIAVLADLERVKAAYLRPQILRDLSILLVYIDGLSAELAPLARQLRAGDMPSAPPWPELAVNQRDHDPWVSSADPLTASG